MIWVVTANTNTCRIYDYDKKSKQLNLLREIQHPENRQKTSELLTDRPGHYQTRGTARGAYSSRTGAKEVEINNFAREIAEELNSARNEHEFEQLIIISPPHMNGILFQHINKHIKDVVIHNIKKDLHHLTDSDLLDFLQTNTKYTER